MPNHVINEVIFSDLSRADALAVLAGVRNTQGRIDFAILLPVPLNAWMSSCSSMHEKTFRLTALDWQTQNWGTKWNAYGIDDHSIVLTDDRLVLTFQTAWSPPYGWLLAIFNKFKVSFQHNWLDEGASRGICGTFNYAAYVDGDIMADAPWQEIEADDAMHRHLHKLLWGVEEFAGDEDEAA